MDKKHDKILFCRDYWWRKFLKIEMEIHALDINNKK